MAFNSRPAAFNTAARNGQQHHGYPLYHQTNSMPPPQGGLGPSALLPENVKEVQPFVPTRTATNLPADMLDQAMYDVGAHPSLPLPPVCPFWMQGNCTVNGSFASHCQHGMHSTPHYQQQAATGYATPAYNQHSNEFQRGHNTANNYNSHFNYNSTDNDANGQLPTHPYTGTWSNERRAGGAATPPSLDLHPTYNHGQQQRYAVPATRQQLQEDTESADSGTSLNLNETYTRNPYEAQLLGLEYRRQTVASGTPVKRHQRGAPVQVPEEKPTAEVSDPWGAWTVESSNTTSPLNSANPSPLKGMWSYDASASLGNSVTESLLVTPNLSYKSSPLLSSAMVPVLMPPPALAAAPTTVPPRSVDNVASVPTFNLPPAVLGPNTRNASESRTPTDATAKPPAPPAYSSSVKVTSNHWFPDSPLDGRSPLQPPTKPSSTAHSPTKAAAAILKPGAMTVEDVESDLLDQTELIGRKMAPPTPGGTSASGDEEGKFKVHRYRGPRHCRACRFHSKSLHAQVVLTRDLNLRYKLDMTCKVCDETFETCIDDKEWQVLWDAHCKTHSHYLNSLEGSPVNKKNQKNSVVHASHNGGATFNKTSSTPEAKGLKLLPQGTTPERQDLFGTNLEPATLRKPCTSQKTVGTLYKRPAKISSPFTESCDVGNIIAFKDVNGLGLHDRAVQKPQPVEEEDEEIVYMSAF